MLGDPVGKVFIYTNNSGIYSLHQTLNDATGGIHSVSMTNDAINTYLLTSSYDHDVRVYKNNGGTFSLVQTLTDSTTVVFTCWITDDFNYIITGSY